MMIFLNVNYITFCNGIIEKSKKFLEQVADSKSYEAIERIKREAA